MNLPKSEVGSHAFRAIFANDFEEYYLDRPENKATTKAQTAAEPGWKQVHWVLSNLDLPNDSHSTPEGGEFEPIRT